MFVVSFCACLVFVLLTLVQFWWYMLSGWLGRPSPKWPILYRLGWSLACDARTTSCWCYANSTSCSSESVSSSKWHAWFASRCKGRRLSTWQMTAASCPTALGALYGQLTLWLVSILQTYSSHGDRTFAAAGPRLWNSLPVQLHNPDITYGLFRWHLGTLFCRSMNTALCDLNM